MPFIEGFGAGLLLAIIVGPVFFTLLYLSLNQGIKIGIAAALGIFVSDIFCVFICAYGAAEYLAHSQNRYYFGLLGAILLLLLGANYLMKPKSATLPVYKVTNVHYYVAFGKGFLVNFVNPAVFAIWLSIIGFASAKHGFGQPLWVYLAGTLTSILITDVLKAVFANKLSGILNDRWLVRLFRFIGLLMIIFGLRLLYVTIS